MQKKLEKQICTAAKIIKSGGIVAFPTETVYGLGADAFNAKAVEKIFKIKNRPFFDPLIVHICKKEQIKYLYRRVDKRIERLIKKFWPGPLTIVAKKNFKLPDIVTAGLDTVAVRMPANEITLEFIKQCGVPIAAPSANKFGRLSPTTARHVKKQFGKSIDFIIDGGRCSVGLESTIIDLSSKKILVLRSGVITIEDIEKEIGERVNIANNYNKIFPGLLKRHYSPRAKVILFDKSNLKKFDIKNSGFIFFKTSGDFASVVPKDRIEILSTTGDLVEAASNLYYVLHKLDEKGVEKIYFEKIQEIGIGVAIMDRIKKASGNKE